MELLRKRVLSVSAALLLSTSLFSELPAGMLKADAAAVYDLVIDSVRVDSANCKDILGNGVFRYEPSTQILTINGDYGRNNATIIDSEIDGLTVNVIEDSNLKGTFNFNANTTISGAGKLSLESYDSPYTISVHNETSLNITNANLDISGIYPIIGYGTDTKGIYVENSFLTVHGTEAAVQGFDYVSLLKCIITKPSDVLYGAGGIFEHDTDTYAKDVRIIPAYDLWIDSKQATADNCDDILGDGKFYYDPEHRVLGIAGSIEHDPDEELIYSMVPDLTIDFVNDIEMSGYIALYGDTTIVGDGSLTIKTAAESGNTCIRNEHCKLTFDNIQVSAIGNVGIGSPTGTIEVINSDISASGKEQAFAFKDGGFSLTDGKIVYPSAAVVGTDTIYNSSSKKAATVLIKRNKDFKIKLGDISGDGKINVTDIIRIAAYIKGKTAFSPEQIAEADVNGDGLINVTDITKIAAHIKGKKLLV